MKVMAASVGRAVMKPIAPLCPACCEPMKEHGRVFQCEPCRQIIIFFAVSVASPYLRPVRLNPAA
jgi:tRNA(Ile2) C34 agmatinyltransferase TiaS